VFLVLFFAVLVFLSCLVIILSNQFFGSFFIFFAERLLFMLFLKTKQNNKMTISASDHHQMMERRLSEFLRAKGFAKSSILLPAEPRVAWTADVNTFADPMMISESEPVGVYSDDLLDRISTK